VASASNCGGIYLLNSSPVVNRNIIRFNDPSNMDIAKSGGTPTLSNNCIYYYSGLSAGTGDFNSNPALVARTHGNMHIQSGSPCLDKVDYTPAAAEADIDGEPRRMGTYVDVGSDEWDGVTQWPINTPYLTIRVSPDGDDVNDGSDWDHAKRTIQMAVYAAAKEGGQVWVKGSPSGIIYNEHITLIAGVQLYGGFTGTESSVNERVPNYQEDCKSILDGQGSGNVITINSIIINDIVHIDGFTIRNGTHGIYTKAGEVDVCYCVVSNNTVCGIRYYDPGYISVYNNLIVYNHIGVKFEPSTKGLISGNNISYNDTGISCDTTGNPLTISCNIIDHIGLSVNGGHGIDCYNSSITIDRNWITNNICNGASYNGGGISCNNNGGGKPLIYNNVIKGNSANNGGGIFLNDSDPNIYNNTIVNNSCSSYGAGIYFKSIFSSKTATIANNIVAFNTGGYGAYKSGSTGIVTLISNCFYDNGPDNYSSNLSHPSDYIGNPYLATDGVHLTASSITACIDKGDNGYVYASGDIDNGGNRTINIIVDRGADEYGSP
jgi:hypothetical protein